MRAAAELRSVEAALDEIRALARPLGDRADLDPLVERIGDARVVLIGEASHGTAEHHRWRAELTRRLVQERGASFVAVEGDWPDCFAVHRWVTGSTGGTAEGVLRGFERWPAWMWANQEVLRFVTWLHAHNAERGDRVGFYGLDVYSLWDSLRAVLDYLRRNHPEAVEAALAAFRCFEPYDEEPQRYAWATHLVPTDCEDAVVELLQGLRARPRGAGDDPESRFDAEQNAAVLAGAEHYYRTMVRGDRTSWNVRDVHMADTLDRLLAHHGEGARAVVWAHDTHVGDARGTDMVGAGMVNLGQLARDRFGDDDVVLVGLGTHHGSVLAAPSWGAPARRMRVPPAPVATHEDLLHAAVGPEALFVFGDHRDGPWLSARYGHRAIGVVYDPAADERANWVPTRMGLRYDAFLHVDTSHAVEPLAGTTGCGDGEEETLPWGT